MGKIRNNYTPTNLWRNFVAGSLIVVLTILFLIFIPDSAHATEFFVNDVSELISAINSANDEFENPGPDTINLTLGTYHFTIASRDSGVRRHLYDRAARSARTGPA